MRFSFPFSITDTLRALSASFHRQGDKLAVVAWAPLGCSQPLMRFAFLRVRCLWVHWVAGTLPACRKRRHGNAVPRTRQTKTPTEGETSRWGRSAFDGRLLIERGPSMRRISLLDARNASVSFKNYRLYKDFSCRLYKILHIPRYRLRLRPAHPSGQGVKKTP